MKKIINCVMLFFISIYCNSQNVEKEIQTPILSFHGFKLLLNNGENYGNFTTYTSLIIKHNGKIIFADSTNKKEYEYADTLYPLIFKTSENSFELLIETNDRPNKNYLTRFFIQDNKVIKIDTLPTFFCKGKNLDKSKVLIFAGQWDDGEEWEDDNHEMWKTYNPILFYKLFDSGLKLDSALTIERNKIIYGTFKGFKYNGKMPIKAKNLGDRLMKEIGRIEDY